MRILALDLSTNTGFAVFENAVLKHYGLVTAKANPTVCYPQNLIDAARRMGLLAGELIQRYQPERVVIEETNQTNRTRSRYDQKLLEWIQLEVAVEVIKCGFQPEYIDTKRWQKEMGLVLSKDDREQNKANADQRTKAKEGIEGQLRDRYLLAAEKMEWKNLRDRNTWVRRQTKEALKAEMRKVRTSATKRTKKHLAVERVNELFRLNFVQKDNDVCDAILIGAGYYSMKRRESNGTENR